MFPLSLEVLVPQRIRHPPTAWDSPQSHAHQEREVRKVVPRKRVFYHPPHTGTKQEKHPGPHTYHWEEAILGTMNRAPSFTFSPPKNHSRFQLGKLCTFLSLVCHTYLLSTGHSNWSCPCVVATPGPAHYSPSYSVCHPCNPAFSMRSRSLSV